MKLPDNLRKAILTLFLSHINQCFSRIFIDLHSFEVFIGDVSVHKRGFLIFLPSNNDSKQHSSNEWNEKKE